MFNFFKRKRWKQRKQVMKDYPSGSYFIVNCGILSVKTKDIVGLSLWPPEKLESDKKMLALRKSVNKKGWNDPHPSDLHLYMTPKRKYTVSSGGNHRAILADELGISEIKAFMTLIIPRILINKSILLELENLNIVLNNIEKEAINLITYLDTKGIDRFYKYKIEDDRFERMCSEMDTINNKINNILMSEAIRNKLIPNSLINPDIDNNNNKS